MFKWLTPPDINNRERRWRHSLRAMRHLLYFGIATVIGYLIWTLALSNISPELLTFNTFLWLAALFSVGPYDRSVLWSWNSFASKYTFRIAASQFVYWSAFWFGIVEARSASLALAFLSLNMLVSPLMVRHLEPPDERSSLPLLVAIAFLLIASIILIELDRPWSDLDLATLSLFFRDWVPIVCFLIAVIADGFSDRTTYALGKHLKQMTEADKARYIMNIRNRPANTSIDDAIKDCAVYQSIPLCLLGSILLLLIFYLIRSGSPVGTQRVLAMAWPVVGVAGRDWIKC